MREVELKDVMRLDDLESYAYEDDLCLYPVSYHGYEIIAKFLFGPKENGHEIFIYKYDTHANNLKKVMEFKVDTPYNTDMERYEDGVVYETAIKKIREYEEHNVPMQNKIKKGPITMAAYNAKVKEAREARKK